MADENKFSANIDSSQVVQKSLEITNFNWFIEDMSKKLNTRLKSPIFFLKSAPLKLNIIFGKNKKMFLVDPQDNIELGLYFIGVQFHKLDLEYKSAVPHDFKFSVRKNTNNVVSKSRTVNEEIANQDTCKGFAITNFTSERELLQYLSDDGSLHLRLKITPVAETDIKLDENCLTRTKKAFDAFLNSKTLSDVVFHIGKNEFPAHKIILASVSPVFARMFSTDMKENIINKVEVKGFHPNVFNEMLRYIYAGKIENSKSVAFDLYRLAVMYDIDGLKMSCEDYLRKNMSDENVIDILEMADSLNSTTLKKECVSYIDKNLENIHKSDSFKNIKRDLLFDLFCGLRGLEN